MVHEEPVAGRSRQVAMVAKVFAVQFLYETVRARKSGRWKQVVAFHGGCFNVYCHAIRCFYVDFFVVKNGGEEIRGRGAGQRVPCMMSDCTFFFF